MMDRQMPNPTWEVIDMSLSLSLSDAVLDRMQHPVCFPAVRIRRAEPRDIAGIQALFHDVHGHSYSEPYVYDAGQFAAKISRGEILSVVALTDDGRTVGHCALLKDYPGATVARIRMSVVNRHFRNMGCASRLLDELITETRKRNFRAVTSHVVTTHPYAQKAGGRLGFRRVALKVGQASDRLLLDGAYPAQGRRQSVACGFLPIGDSPATRIYPPDHHRDFVDMLFRNAGLERRLCRPGARDCRPVNKRSVIRVHENMNGFAGIIVFRYGLDIISRIERILHNLTSNGMCHLTLELPLTSSFTAIACGQMEQLGFFIAGILPQRPAGDALALQYLHNARVDYNDMVIVSRVLSDIQSYVRGHDPNVHAQGPGLNVKSDLPIKKSLQ